MITKVKFIVSDDPVKQIWKLLHFYLDTKFVANQIREVHGVKDIKQKSNIEKQAREIGYSIRQAEEYFVASSHVRLATRPLLLYYGAVSLTRALVLLRKSGEVSAEALRKNNNHKHHGLDLYKPAKCSTAEEFFATLKAKTHSHPQTKEPWGHFSLFYDSLVSCATSIRKKIIIVGKNNCFEGRHPMSCGVLRDINSLINKDFKMLDLLRVLPDMYYLLQEVGIQPELCRGDAIMEIRNYYEKDSKLSSYDEELIFSIDGIAENQKSHLQRFWLKMNPELKIQSNIGSYMIFKWSENFKVNDVGKEKIYLPDMIEDIDGYKFYFTKPEEYLPEPAIHLILLFSLGMLARYSPDLWMSAIDKDVRTAELTDSFLNIVYRKFPNLVLDQLTRIKHTLRK